MSGPEAIVVTGADGFIGTRLVADLRARGERPVVAVTLEAGFDLARPGWTERLPRERADTVVHLAQSFRYRDFPDGARDLFAVNVAAAAELLEWARLHGARRFLLASTGNVYAPAAGRVDEQYPCCPDSFYAATKYSAELLASRYASFFHVIRMRLFSVYGPGQRRMLVPDMMARLDEGREIVLAGGEGLRLTPLYVDDAVDRIRGLVALEDGAGDECFNLCGEDEATLAEIVSHLGRLMGRAPNVRAAEGAPARLLGDGARLRGRLGSRPFVPLAEGLARTVAARKAAD
ncbi:MAG: NAD(P)-dependent oxidoreductase [Kiritimatiellae bacterium]|nr:NAD(P)-dependent oxidoreductase [Kiritimatiellia bacterium]